MRPRLCVICLTLTALLAACRKEETIQSYRSPKDPPVILASTSGAQGLKWTAPPSWKELPAGQMRVAAYAVTDAQPPVEFTVIPLGPEAGALVPNINRWEGQLGLPASPPDKVDQLVKKESINGLDVSKVDLAGGEKRMLAAIVPFGGKTWYFKMLGPKEVIQQQQENFDSFIHSLTPDQTPGQSAPAVPDSSPLPAAPHNHAPSVLTKYTAPPNWKEIPNPTPPRMLAFKIDDATELVVTRFGGNNAGSFEDNVNRWRGQLGLPPVQQLHGDEMKMRDVKVGNGLEGMAVEFHNPDTKKSMLVAMTSAGADDLWFFKLTGPTDSVEKQRAPLEEFLKSIEFAEGTAVDPHNH